MAAPKSNKAEKLFAERFAFHAQFNGDRDTKRLSTQAKSLATGIRRLRDSYKDHMTAAQIDALNVACSAMTELAKDAEKASVLARQAQVDRQQNDLQRRAAKAEAIAMERWGDLGEKAKKSTFMDEMRDLVDFVDLKVAARTPHGATNTWIGDKTIELEIEGGYSGPQLMRMLEAYEKDPTPERLGAMRLRAAEYIDGLNQARGSTWRASIVHYETWRTNARDQRNPLSAVMHRVSQQPKDQAPDGQPPGTKPA